MILIREYPERTSVCPPPMNHGLSHCGSTFAMDTGQGSVHNVENAGGVTTTSPFLLQLSLQHLVAVTTAVLLLWTSRKTIGGEKDPRNVGVIKGVFKLSGRLG